MENEDYCGLNNVGVFVPDNPDPSQEELDRANKIFPGRVVTKREVEDCGDVCIRFLRKARDF